MNAISQNKAGLTIYDAQMTPVSFFQFEIVLSLSLTHIEGL